MKEKAEFVDVVDVYMDARQRILDIALQQRKSVAVIDSANKLTAFCKTFALGRVIDIAYALANQSTAFLELDAHAEAAAAAEQAIAALSDSASPHDELLALALTNLGTARLEQGYAAEAEPVLQKASALAEAHFGSADDRTRGLHRRLAEIATKLGDMDRAKSHALKSIKISRGESQMVVVNPAAGSSGETRRIISFVGDEAPDEDIANLLADLLVKSFSERHDP